MKQQNADMSMNMTHARGTIRNFSSPTRSKQLYTRSNRHQNQTFLYSEIDTTIVPYKKVTILYFQIKSHWYPSDTSFH